MAPVTGAVGRAEWPGGHNGATISDSRTALRFAANAEAKADLEEVVARRLMEHRWVREAMLQTCSSGTAPPISDGNGYGWRGT
jgi:hypothetical protein